MTEGRHVETIRIYSDNPAVLFRTRMHVLGADLRIEGDLTVIVTWCDCGWINPDPHSISIPEDIGSIPYPDLVEAVAPWRDHLWLSGRLYRAHTNQARADRKASKTEQQT